MPKYLQLSYSAKNKSLFFSDCDIQEIIQKNIDIHQVIKFTALFGPEDDEFMEVRKLYYFHTYWDLVFLNEDHGYRFFETDTLFQNGMRMTTDLNLTSIWAPSEKDLFEFIAVSLTSFGLVANEIINHIKTRPGEWLAILAEDNGDLRIETWSEELSEEWIAKTSGNSFLPINWSREVSEEGVPEMVPF